MLKRTQLQTECEKEKQTEDRPFKEKKQIHISMNSDREQGIEMNMHWERTLLTRAAAREKGQLNP